MITPRASGALAQKSKSSERAGGVRRKTSEINSTSANTGKVEYRINGKTSGKTISTSSNTSVVIPTGQEKPLSKGLKGIGITRSFIGTKRMRKLTKDNIRAVTKGDIRRLARRGGVKRISGTIYDEIRKSMKSFLEMVLKDTCEVVEHAQRKTVTVTDIIFVLRRVGRPMYGFDHLAYLKSIKGSY